ncbi:major royal jelly protein 2-like [Diprion similis]|uniref:major royal jelly protein 2-like n=1 Tax=Diprion similis TaxID=362088 RepID=UPI001EF863B9|nr:major royal jelly protein 2-like [Diprion similis]
MVSPLLFVVPLLLSGITGELHVRFEWKYIDYVWKNSEHKQKAVDSGDYNYTKIFPIDVDRSRDGRVFVTTPRYDGVPASLSLVSNLQGEGGPLLRPYPDWSWHQKGNCTTITSVWRVAMDECNRLWVMDSGRYGEDLICDPQILVFDLADDSLVKRIAIPSQYARNPVDGSSQIITIALETRGACCERTWIFMADVEGFGLVVSDNGERFARFNDTSFTPDPKYTNFTILGQKFYQPDGLFSLAVQPKKRFADTSRLFYRPLASLSQYYASTRQLIGDLHMPSSKAKFQRFNYTYPSQVSIQAFSSDGILFTGCTSPPSILCWNSRKPFNEQNVVTIARNDETLQFTSAIKIKDREMWAFTIRYQKIATGTQNFSEINYRIVIEHDIRNLVKNSACTAAYR